MILTEASREELKGIIAAFKRHPLVKRIAATPQGEIFNLEFSEEESQSLYRAIHILMKNPFAAAFISKRLESESLPIREPFNPRYAHRYAWLVKDFIGQGGRAARGTLSAEVKKYLQKWVSNNSMSADLPNWIQTELMHIPEIRPDKPVVLYRGLLFQKRHMEPDDLWTSRVPWRRAKKYVETLMAGKDAIRMESPNASSWTTSKSVAERFATSRAATSQYGGMQNWLHAAKIKSQIQGEMGLVVSTIARPEEIIVDLRTVDIGFRQHGDEGEVILAGGDRLARMVDIWLPQGLVSVEDFQKHMRAKQSEAETKTAD